MKRNYLYRKLATSVFGSAIAFSILTSVAWFAVELHRSSEKTIGMLNQLLDTVENTAAISAYSGNRQIGEDVLQGLLSNDIVHEARLSNDQGLKLSLTRHSRMDPADSVARPLRSPFGEEIVGQLEVFPESSFNYIEARRSAMYSALNSSLLIGLTALIVLLVVRTSLSRPLRSVSETLHAIKAGKQERLELLPAHRDDEFGQLICDINGLLDTLEEKFEAERHLRKEIQDVEHRLRSVFETTSVGIFLLDENGLLRMANPTLGRVLRLPDFRPENYTGRDLLEQAFAEPQALRNLMPEARERTKPLALDLQLKCAGDVWVHCLLSKQSDSQGTVLYQGVIYDITERRAVERRIRLEADYDPLTGLYRRKPAERAIRKFLAIPPSPDGAHVVLLLDLDNFKCVNDTEGHAAGDTVLVEIARRLRACVRTSDIVARIGGDEFLIVLVDCVPVENARKVAQEIVCKVVQPIDLRPDAYAQVGVSIGIAIHDAERRTVKDLIEAADLAMYEVKRRGKNGFGITGPGTTGVSVEKIVSEECQQSYSLDRLGSRGFKDSVG